MEDNTVTRKEIIKAILDQVTKRYTNSSVYTPDKVVASKPSRMCEPHVDKSWIRNDEMNDIGPLDDPELVFRKTISSSGQVSATNVEREFDCVMDRANSPTRRPLVSKYTMPRKDITTDGFYADVLNVLSPSFIYVREKHHCSEMYNLKKECTLYPLLEGASTSGKLGVHDYELPEVDDRVLWRYCYAPLDEDTLARVRIIGRQKDGKAVDENDANQMLLVFYIDYGVSAWVLQNVCFEFKDDEIFTYPPQSIAVSLVGLKPKAKTTAETENDLERKWSNGVCAELRNLLKQYPYYEIVLETRLAVKKTKLQTYAVQIYGLDSLPENNNNNVVTKSCDYERHNINQMLSWRCFDEIEAFDDPIMFQRATKYDLVWCDRFQINTPVIPEYLKERPHWIKVKQITPIVRTSTEVENNRKQNARIPPLAVPLDIWPRGSFPWDYESLVATEFIKFNIIGFVTNNENAATDCIGFSAIPILYFQLAKALNGEKSVSKQIKKIFEARSTVQSSLNEFYRIRNNRRSFNWDYVYTKLESYEPVNCIVGVTDKQDPFNFICKRARIHYLIENLLDEFESLATGVINTSRKKHIRFAIVELYDYADVVIVPADTICQIHPMHDSVNPFSIRLGLDYDIGFSKRTTFSSLVKPNKPEISGLRERLTRAVCTPTPKRAIIQDGPRSNMKLRYKFEYFIHPWEDPFVFRIKFVEDIWNPDPVFMDQEILVNDDHFHRYCIANRVDMLSVWDRFTYMNISCTKQEFEDELKRKKLEVKTDFGLLERLSS
uniref:Tudor domain-containing protein n=1 Tax=Rhabditophanes sp. KR3021 TaxID=114890 RepID=A0AC35U9G7_9BILA